MFGRRFTAVQEKDGRFGGFDGEILNLLEESLNFRAVFTPKSDDEEYGFRDKNGTFHGSLGDLVYHRSDISLNGVFLKDYKSKEIVFTVTIQFDKLCVAVPSSRPIPNWKAIFLCFERDVWTCIIVTYFVTAIVWYIMRRIIDLSSVVDCSEVAIVVYGIFLLIPLNKLPENVPERIFLTAMMLSSLLIATCFQGSLLSLLSRELYEKEINTLEDLGKSTLRINTNSKNLLDTFDGGDNALMKVLRKKLLVGSDVTLDILERVTRKRDIGALGRDLELKIRIGSNYTKGGRGLAHVVDDCPRTYHLGYIMARGTPFYEAVNSALGRIFSAGIVYSPKLTHAYLTSWNKYKRSQGSDASSVVPEAFTLEKLKIAFAFLILGFVLSTTVFTIEIFIGKKIIRD
jgi:hypothetical protein